MFYELIKVQREVARGIHAGLGEVIKKQRRLAFNQKKDPISDVAWARRKYIYPHPLLVKTGKLKNSVKVKKKGKNRSDVVSIFYGKYHQFGAEHRNLVARRFVGIDIKVVKGLIQRGLQKLK